MEKFRKFDDSRVGVNPFVPTKPAEISTFQAVNKAVFSTLFLLFKVPFVIIMLLLLTVSHLLKYLLVVPALIRLGERLTDKILLKCLTQTFALMRWTELFHKEDANYDFVKDKKGELYVNNRDHISKSEPTLILANDPGVLSYLWLCYQFSPLMVVMDFDQETKRAGLRPVGPFELLQRAIGIRFPSPVPEASLFKSFREVRESRFVQNRPLVFFPECTRSNGKGILEFPNEAIHFIQGALWTDKFQVHAIRFDFSTLSTTQQPYNSTDVTGVKHAFTMLSQFANKMSVQYLFNLEAPAQCGSTANSKTPDELKKKIKDALVSKGHEYHLQKDWRDHQEFLKYWNSNQ